MNAGKLLIKFRLIFCFFALYYPLLCYSQCPLQNYGDYCCSADDKCICSGTAIACNYVDDFPIFSYCTNTFHSVSVLGNGISAIYDNSFYLLANMTNATVCLSNPYGYVETVTTYSETFRTEKKNGIKELYFYSYNPVNISTMSNSDEIQLLSITSAELETVPDLRPFTSLSTAIFDYNKIVTVEKHTFNNPRLTQVSLNGNPVTEIEPKAFSSGSIYSIDLSNTKMSSLISDGFNFTSLKEILAENNNITYIDPKFSNWLSLSTNNTINLEYNQPYPCDSSMQWMASYVVCPPQQILIHSNALCESGEPMLNYLINYAKCVH